MVEPTDREMQKFYYGFETHDLLKAVDLIDELRGYLGYETEGGPPEIRDNMLKLHGLALSVVNKGDKSRVQDLFDLAAHLQDQVQSIRSIIGKVEGTLSGLAELYPESLSD